MRAFIFPGQGAQIIGMGKDLAEHYESARAIFEEVDSALDEKLSEIIWSGDIETLTLTQNAQPALMAMSVATMAALAEEGVGFDEHIKFVAGHSLGEYSALCAAGGLNLDDTARLLRLRGKSMQDAVPVGVGAMAALLGLGFEQAHEIAEKAAQDQICQAANDNDPSQVVISGHKEAVERACELAKEAGAKRAVMLPVSAPFHCQLMEPAAKVMAQALDDVEVYSPAVPLIANVTAQEVNSPSAIRSLLVEQVTGSVRWRESVMFMAEHDITQTIEVGAGKALSGMVKRTEKGIETLNCGTVDQVKQVAETILKGDA